MYKIVFFIFILVFTASCLKKPVANIDFDKNIIQNNKVYEDKPKEEQTKDQDLEVVLPIKEFSERITKKPFGIYITPETSPVQPERFSGYHTGVDVEYDDVEAEVDVYAIAEGVVEYSGWVAGYGGVMAISYNVDGREYLAIYGHLNPDKLIKQGEGVIKGEQIGILGNGYTSETDGERKHLHFSLYKGSDINLRGYVISEEYLLNWEDPEKFLN